MKLRKEFMFRAGPEGEIVQGRVLIDLANGSDACGLKQNLNAIINKIENEVKDDRPDLIIIGDKIEQAIPQDWELSFVEFKDYSKYYE